jgi:hypothetical protein
MKGIIEGINKSGFEIDFDIEELRVTVYDLVMEHVGPQGHDITKILVALRYITVGLRVYLISLCIEGEKKLPISTVLVNKILDVISIVLIKVLVKTIK